MPTSNPWLSLSFSDPIIAPCDQKVIQTLAQSDRDNLYLDLFPEPFIGDPDADVYLLNGNPGFSDLDSCFSCSSALSSIMKGIYSHKIKDFLWNDPNNPIKATCPITKRTIIAQGQVYWQKRLKELSKAVNSYHLKLFNLEFYPYHSKTFLPFMQKPLPSFDYTRDLVNDAISKGKMIIILRHKDEWENAIPGLNKYRTYSLTNPRSSYLTKRNLENPAWTLLTQKCI